MTTRFEVVFIATPALGNLVPIVEFANLLTKHDPRFSATVLTIHMPQRPLVNTYVQSRASESTSLRILHLPTVDPPAPDNYHSSIAFLSLHLQNHKHHVKEALLQLARTQSNSPESVRNDSNSPDSVRLAAVFVDMFGSSLVDVAAEINVPCYLFYASPASFLGFTLNLPRVDSESEFTVPSFENSLPRPVLPNAVLELNDGFSWFLSHATKYRETKGIIVNTIQELEYHALQSLYNDSKLPRVYPIGPVVDLVGSAQWDPNPAQCERIFNWLDKQPRCSVVFLCFGSMGSLKGNQVGEIAIGLERAQVRFLWALREPPEVQLEDPRDYDEVDALPLPDGFLKRTAGIGLVCGWVPQAKVLAHNAIGGFVSHCGWNSILESLWNGVPVATWPLYAEQRMNAFQMVRELGLAVEINMVEDLMRAEEVESGVRTLMEGSNEIRRKVKEMSEKCREALMVYSQVKSQGLSPDIRKKLAILNLLSITLVIGLAKVPLPACDLVHLPSPSNLVAHISFPNEQVNHFSHSKQTKGSNESIPSIISCLTCVFPLSSSALSTSLSNQGSHPLSSKSSLSPITQPCATINDTFVSLANQPRIIINDALLSPTDQLCVHINGGTRHPPHQFSMWNVHPVIHYFPAQNILRQADASTHRSRSSTRSTICIPHECPMTDGYMS
ncbi:hypothetical protein VNO78_03177 [Psophocarpus tetragonolobus]|uniref:UDP-glycosyltransferases domain-containing protein n=1 Tax=Psophocarpus tetragonolobus TaxID=3891 RepID=A0AAN9T0N9_PSOTE